MTTKGDCKMLCKADEGVTELFCEDKGARWGEVSAELAQPAASVIDFIVLVIQQTFCSLVCCKRLPGLSTPYCCRQLSTRHSGIPSWSLRSNP